MIGYRGKSKQSEYWQQYYAAVFTVWLKRNTETDERNVKRAALMLFWHGEQNGS